MSGGKKGHEFVNGRNSDSMRKRKQMILLQDGWTSPAPFLPVTEVLHRELFQIVTPVTSSPGIDTMPYSWPQKVVRF
jgi:hypothetical protein